MFVAGRLRQFRMSFQWLGNEELENIDIVAAVHTEFENTDSKNM